MKKTFKGLALSLMAVFMLVFVTGCGDKVAVSSSEFKSKMEGKGYVVQDAKDQFADYDYVQEVYIAASSDYTYQLEYYKLDTEENAIQFYNTNKLNFESTKGNGAIETTVNIGNNAKYTLKTNGKYSVISRIDNTVIYVNATDTYESNVKDALKDLGY